MKKIAEIVEKMTGVDLKAMKSGNRSQSFVWARTLCASLAHEIGYSASSIAKFLTMDHTSILYLLKKGKKDPKIGNLVAIHKERLSLPVKNNVGIVKKYSFVYEKFDGKCAVCSHSSVVEVAHIVPKCLGGSDDMENLLLLCPTHHRMMDKGLLFIKDIHTPY